MYKLYQHLFQLVAQSFFLSLLLIACSESETERWQRRASRVEIIRDDFGVPHVYGKSDADAVFGMIYAQCEDDFKRIERNYLAAIGRLAEAEGEKFLYNDLRARLFMTIDEAQESFKNAPDWLKTLCEAWADGINYYLHTHPEVKPKLLTRFEPWMPLYFSEGSIGGNIENISVNRLKDFYEKNQSNHTALADVNQPVWAEPSGSNGIALSGKVTESGKAMLLINPHTSFYFRGEIHVVSEEGLNAYGAVTWGQFFIYQGFNEKNGWMHTSSGTDVMDEFIETTALHDGKLHYKYGTEWRPVIEKPITLSYREGDSVFTKTFTIYRTHHGPITHAIDTAWVATAMLWDPVRALEQSYKRMKTASLEEFKKVLNLRTNSSNNTVYADADGNIAYFHGNFIPRRSSSFDYSKPVDGSNPATDWQGLHEVNETVQVINPANGWIQNCNSTPFTSALEYSPKKENYPVYMAPDPENFRGIHAVRILTGQRNINLDKLIELAYDPQLPAFEYLVPGLLEAFKKGNRSFAHLKPVIDTLGNWDFRTSKKSVAMTLAHFYASRLLAEGPRSEGQSPMHRLIQLGTQTTAEFRLTILTDVVNRLKEDFGTWAMPWGEVNRFQRLTGEIEQKFDDNQPSIAIGLASGNWGALASYGARGVTNTKKLYGSYGNSFVAVVEFGDNVRAKSILAGGQSGDPASPHFTDQAQRYADIQFKDVAFYRADVEKRAERRYHPGN
ncbi:MAG: acylase [Cyclobacteriaceae bacterium]|nr:acylase [Cyclobacteriaceae bacterium]